MAIYAIGVATFPHYPEKFKNPLYEVSFRLLGDGLASPNLGAALGLGRVASVVPWFALIAGLWLAAAVGDAWRTRWRDAALAAALAALVIVGYRGFPRGGKVADDAYVNFVGPTVAVAPR